MKFHRTCAAVALELCLVILFSAAAVNYAAAELDCVGRQNTCHTGCRGDSSCQNNCWNDRYTCERTNERERD